MAARNARFWYYVNDSWVKITLREGQALTHNTGGPTDEGYSYSSQTWTHTGAGVMLEWCCEARDCDGRFDRAGDSFCPLDSLASRVLERYDDATGEDVPDPTCPPVPEWKPGDSYQRDYSAEAAGY